ncbi:MAG: AgmX/PglI C-terminal domain-containing protein [Deltaproteobacteria bacterium]|nr:AgmX/PglI C-terminal domain-containing protein [Deltaproteobacteria bacterium]
MLVLRALGLGAMGLAGLTGCGGSPPPKTQAPQERVIDAPPSRTTDTDGTPDDGMKVGGDGILGSLDEEVVGRTLQPKLEEFSGCFNKHKRLQYVGGTITLRYRVARDGSVKRLGYLSDLGSWQVERCVLDIARAVGFPRPKGGEAEFEYPAAFRPKQRHQVWDSDRISADIHKHERQLKACAGAPKSYALTFYIGAGGKTTSVGFSSPEPWGNGMDAFAECVVEKARGWHFTDPLGEITKATYTFE